MRAHLLFFFLFFFFFFGGGGGYSRRTASLNETPFKRRVSPSGYRTRVICLTTERLTAGPLFSPRAAQLCCPVSINIHEGTAVRHILLQSAGVACCRLARAAAGPFPIKGPCRTEKCDCKVQWFRLTSSSCSCDSVGLWRSHPASYWFQTPK